MHNLIYLGDLLLLTSGAVVFGAPTGLALVPVLAAVLRRSFGAAFEGWAIRTRRWLYPL